MARSVAGWACPECPVALSAPLPWGHALSRVVSRKKVDLYIEQRENSVATARVGLIEGDGIGPEITAAARAVLDASGADLEWVDLPAGESAFHTHGSAMPTETVEAALGLDAVLKGPMAVPMSGYSSPNQGLRFALGAFANVRSVQYFQHNGANRYPGLNLTIIRDVTEDLTRGASQEIGDGIAGVALKVVSRPAVERLARFALSYAEALGGSRVTVTHLAPSQRDTDGLFLRVMLEVGEAFPALSLDEEAIDPLMVHLVQDPTRYHILVSPNLYGGILCGLLAGLAGSVGLMPGANLGGAVPIFEPGHGTAPRYAGANRANPVGCILSGAMMLEHLGDHRAGARIRRSVAQAIEHGHATPDIGGESGTTEFAQAIAARCLSDDT